MSGQLAKGIRGVHAVPNVSLQMIDSLLPVLLAMGFDVTLDKARASQIEDLATWQPRGLTRSWVHPDASSPDAALSHLGPIPHLMSPRRWDERRQALEAALREFAAHSIDEQYHESLGNVTPADVHFERQCEALAAIHQACCLLPGSTAVDSRPRFLQIRITALNPTSTGWIRSLVT
jgi:hypothetical protein